MRQYLISVVITAILIALSELILPQGRLKTVINTVFAIVLLLCLISPISDLENFELTEDVFNEQTILPESDDSVVSYFDSRIANYYENEFKKKLFDEDLITERIEVEICNTQIVKIQIFLSNLVIPEENSHININVIRNYLSEILSVDLERIEVYA